LSGGIRLDPISVSWYSTRGGTLAYIFLEISPSRSIPRRVCVSTLGEIFVTACCNALARCGPGVRKCRSVMRHLSDSNSTASRDCKVRFCTSYVNPRCMQIQRRKSWQRSMRRPLRERLAISYLPCLSIISTKLVGRMKGRS
jgi:hypothetical protein